jgi:hypothetical protein
LEEIGRFERHFKEIKWNITHQDKPELKLEEKEKQ